MAMIYCRECGARHSDRAKACPKCGYAAFDASKSVAVGNVKRGEVSVGGGYGYYNSQSAVALGAAMGLSDNWSVNAGAGLASGDKTQLSFRAGTNYKFKLF